MPLTAGTRLGPYTIASMIGAGGMGEVYKARDTRLDRDVAIKVLAPALAARLARERVPFDSALTWAVQVADALALAHARGVVRRDLKPANLFLLTAGGIKVLDFGVVGQFRFLRHQISRVAVRYCVYASQAPGRLQPNRLPGRP